MIYLSINGQNFSIYQTVDVEQYQGKNFVLEGKIFYKNKIASDSWAVLGTVSIDKNGKQIKEAVYNDNATDYYKEGDWSSYEINGKIDKNAKYLGLSIAVAGNGSYYVDHLKLFVKQGNDKVEVTLKNSDFENDSLTDWKSYNLDTKTKLSLTGDKIFSGKQALFIDNSNVQVKATFGNNPERGKYLDANGVKLYYEMYGNGTPLLLLHGNNSSMGSFENQLEELSKKYTVIGLDSRGQGKSSSNDTKITYELMAEDVNSFLNKLQLKNVNVLGWSDGGNIAVILAMEHPEKVNKIAIMGTVLYNDATSVTEETNDLIRSQIKAMEEKGISKNNMDYRLKMLLLTEPHINPDSLQKIKSPTLVMAGEYDVVKKKHTELISQKIHHSQLVIFKGADHEAPKKIPAVFNSTIISFFDENNNKAKF